MNQTNTVMVAIFIVLGVMLVAGLIAIPAIEQAVQADKGGVPNYHASDNARGRDNSNSGGGGGHF